MPYQHLGEACQATQAACPGFPDVSGLNEAAFHEQTQVTRCGSQECGWGSWTTPAAAHEPVGVYRNPWFMTYANAEKRWKHADE